MVALAALVAAVLLGVLREGDDEPAAGTGAVVLVGDSLSVGMASYLADELRGWSIRDDSVVGRSTVDGLDALAALPGTEPVVVSLGTNDPTDGVDAFAEEVVRALTLAGPARCLVWATLWRHGGPDDAFNDVLRRAADANQRLRLLEWDVMVTEHPDWLAGDGLHGSPAGYAARAREAARLVRECPRAPGDDA